MTPRRILFALLVAAINAALLWLAVRATSPGGWTSWEALTLLCFAGTAPWTALCAANALTGFAIRTLVRDPTAYVLPAVGLPPARATPPATPRTAIAVCVRNEDMDAVLPPLAPLLIGLDPAQFTLWILSDTQEPAAAAAEAAAIATFRAAHPAHAPRIHYRRRERNTGYKAGNVMDFCDHHAAGHDLLLCLDADSVMTPAAVGRLVACMVADPRLAIVQQLIVGRPATAAFPRLFQFGMRQGMRLWATGQAWWQGAHGPYWGHNAILRIAPFRAHCRLGPLPDGTPILSHDQVEAVRLHAADWKVMCLPDEAGSLEGNPPALPEFLARDLRWAAGNMQYWALLKLPGMTAMGRLQLLQAILLFLGAPLWLGVLVFATLNAATGGGATTPTALLATLMLATWAALHAPKLLGYVELLASPADARPYGGRRAVLRGAALEIAFTTVLDPISILNKARFLLTLPFGRRRAAWAPQNRADRGIAWPDAARLLWPHTLLGAALFALLLATAPAALPWALPPAGGLLLAIPFCVLTADPRAAAWLRARAIAATPEERHASPEPHGAVG